MKCLKINLLALKSLALLTFMSCHFSCSSQSETLYIKRDNSDFADAIIYEFVFCVKKDSFKIIGYHERSFNAVIETGPVFIKENHYLSLVVEDTKYISLRNGKEKMVKLPKEDVRYMIEPVDDYYEYDILKYENNQLKESFYEYPFYSIDSLSHIESWLLSDMTDAVPVIENGLSMEFKSIAPPPPPPKIDSTLTIEEERLESQRQQNIENLASEIADACSITAEQKVVMQLKIAPKGNILSYELTRTQNIDVEKIACLDQLISENATTNLGELKVLSTGKSRGRATDILYTVVIKSYDK